MANQEKRKRVALTIKGGGKSRARNNGGGKRLIAPDRIIGIVQDQNDTWVRHEYENTDISAQEGLEALLAQAGDELIKLTPIGFANGQGEAVHRYGDQIAVNVDFLTILSDQDERGAIVAIDGCQREIVVSETISQIEALINGV
ncbi:hypothetical protein MXMO3_01831 [Maritalea myrionectae]|uniref:Uncharacterized protein n=1 Tax=Maritalea myrionectae TaxID=454601 RepID=A0A2R4MEP2_9HYPH|nr:hypothetical protein [Maritalea myrionectae]AVX04356.1 hypothetical protein MXMO3_01831 [Maritalea myrionectae]